MGLAVHLVRILTQLSQKLVLDHTGHRTQRDQQQGYQSYLPTEQQRNKYTQNKRGSHIHKT
jgi:hypothetical protein